MSEATTVSHTSNLDRIDTGASIMGDFLQFYSNGGLFMHVITLVSGSAVTALVLHRRSRERAQGSVRLLELAERLAWMCVAVGLLGSVFGLFDVCMALQSLGPEDMALAGLRGMGLVPVTTAWGLMVAIPIWALASIQRMRVPVPARAS